MKCVSYNIQYGLVSDGRYDLARIAGEVADADIIALQEVDRYWQRSGMVDGPAVLADHLPRHHRVYGANLDVDASYADAGRIVQRRKQFGTMILSHLCEATRMPQIAAMKDILERAAAEGGAWCGGHPDPASGWIEEEEPPMPRACIVMGDMNFGPSSREYATLIGDVAPGYGRLTNRAGLLDAWVVAGHEEAAGSSHTNAGRRIDHALISTDLAKFVGEMRIDNQARGSDHWPVWLTFDVP